MNAGVPIQTPESDPFRAESMAFWRKLGQDMLRDSLKTIDKVGKQIIAVDGILAGLYFNAVAFSDLHKQALSFGPVLLYAAPVVLLLLSLTAALLIFYPDRSKVDLRSSTAIELIHRRAVTGKLALLRAAALLLILGVACIAAALVAYLSGG
jgi:hypothetical protein